MGVPTLCIKRLRPVINPKDVRRRGETSFGSIDDPGHLPFRSLLILVVEISGVRGR